MNFETGSWGAVATFGVLIATTVFLVVCGGVQVARKDLDPMHIPLTLYLNGRWGGVVRGAYYSMSAGLLALAAALAIRDQGEALGWLAPALLVISAVSLPFLVFTRPRSGQVLSERELHHHRAGTYFTFFNLIGAMCVVSFTQGAVGAAQAVWGLLLSITAVIGLLLTIFARHLPRGLVQKALILTIVLWLYWVVASLLVGGPA